MACQIQELAEHILANREIAKDALWNRVNEVMGQPSKSYIAPEVKSNSKLPVELINPEHHEFNKLPFYKEGQKTMTYAGIGSRETPDEVLEVMTKAAQWLASKGYKLQTGYKRKTGDRIKEEGADKAFSIGAKNKELFGPDMANDKTIAIAHEVYPNLKGMWEYTYNKWVETVGETKAKEYADGAINLQARNTFQVFGASLDTPVDFVLFYAEETSNPLRPKGGTGQAVEMARRKGIPTINMMDKNWRKQLEEVLQFKKGETSDNDTKVGFDDNNTTSMEQYQQVLQKFIKDNISFKIEKQDWMAYQNIFKTAKDYDAAAFYVREINTVYLPDYDTLLKDFNNPEAYGTIGAQIRNDTGWGSEDLEFAIDKAKNELSQTHIKTHEYIHAAALIFMSKNPDHPATKRINKVFELVKDISTKDPKKFNHNNKYWSTSVDEFLAEALSNPGMIEELMNTKMDGSKTFTPLSSIFSKLLKSIINIFKLTKEEELNLHTYLMDSFIALVEVQQKQEVDIIQPSEMFTKNINKMMKC